jgi:surfactin synthase thioesterase subunit
MKKAGFKASNSTLKQLIRKHKIPVRMMFGRYDKIINYAGGEKFKEGIEEFITMKIVESGHHLLGESHVDKIVQLIND